MTNIHHDPVSEYTFNSLACIMLKTINRWHSDPVMFCVYWMWIPKALLLALCISTCKLLHVYINSSSISNGKVYHQHLLICGSSLWTISSQTDAPENHPFLLRLKSELNTVEQSPPCGWFNVMVLYRQWTGLRSILIRCNQPIERGQRAEWQDVQ